MPLSICSGRTTVGTGQAGRLRSLMQARGLRSLACARSLGCVFEFQEGDFGGDAESHGRKDHSHAGIHIQLRIALAVMPLRISFEKINRVDVERTQLEADLSAVRVAG